jgi:hypothetical protein
MFCQSLHIEDNDVNSYGVLYIMNYTGQVQVINNQIHLFGLIFDR